MNFDKRLLSIKDICNQFEISRSTVYEWIHKDLLPKPISLTSRCVRFKAQDIEELVRKLYGDPVEATDTSMANPIDMSFKRKWVGLTNAEEFEIIERSISLTQVIRRTEAKLKEKNT